MVEAGEPDARVARERPGDGVEGLMNPGRFKAPPSNRTSARTSATSPMVPAISASSTPS